MTQPRLNKQEQLRYLQHLYRNFFDIFLFSLNINYKLHNFIFFNNNRVKEILQREKSKKDFNKQNEDGM